MSAADVTEFISRLVVHFGEPKFDVPDGEKPTAHKQWLRDMVRSLSNASREVLDRAGNEIIDRRKYRSFPLLNDIRSACDEVAQDIRRERPKLALEGKPVSAYGGERERLAYDLILGPLGRRAAKEGWVHSLFTWTRDNMRLPTADHEIRFCIDGARGFDREFDKCRAAESGSLNAKLVPLGMAMLAKREALARYVETGVLP